jgi:hypothetical protein
MVDQVVNASLVNRLQKIRDCSIDSRLESVVDSKVRSSVLRVNDETAKKQIEIAEPNATLIKPSFFCNNSQDSRNYSNQVGTSGVATSTPPSRSAYSYPAPNSKPNSPSAWDPPRYSIEHVHEQFSKMVCEQYGIEPTI